jgi:two-component system OmpR family response regulator
MTVSVKPAPVHGADRSPACSEPRARPYTGRVLSRSPPTPPRHLALVDDDADHSQHLAAFLAGQGVDVQVFHTSEALLVSAQPFDFDFYILDLMLPGIDGLSLLRVLRQRSDAGVLVITGKVAHDVFDSVISAGADMHLAKPASNEQIALAMHGVYRRSAKHSLQQAAWQLDARKSLLLTPQGTAIELSPTDLSVLSCLLDAKGATVSREALRAYLGMAPDEDPNVLNATIYRLRRRIERATDTLAPLQAKSREGYVFRAPLTAA